MAVRGSTPSGITAKDGGAPNAKAAAKAWLKAESRHGRKPALPVILAGLAVTVLAVGQAWCVAYVLGGALAGDRGARLLPACAGFAALGLLRMVVQMVGERYAFAAGARARRRLRSATLSRLLAAGPVALGGRHSGDLTAIVVDKVEALDGLFANWLPASSLALASPLLVLVVAFWADPLAALVLALAGLLVPIGMAAAGIGAATAFRRQFLSLSRLQARFLDRVRGIATIVMAGRADDEAAALAQAARELRQRTMRVLRVAFLSSIVLDLAAAGALVILALHYGFGASHAAQGVRTALFVLLLVPEFFAPLRTYAAAYQDRLHATAAAESLAQLPEAPAPLPDLPVRTIPARGVSVTFEDVSLTWDPARGPALDGLSFRLPAGETLVLAGPSGAGKSTTLEILLGFVRPDGGRVLINGADIKDLVPQALARLTAWIGQRPMLFAGSIRDNILFARPEANAADVEAAARNAHVTDFAAALPAGLDTPVGEAGYGLSGGQAQRVAIARAFLKNAPLLLLDEPTAHLDPASEAAVLDSLRRLAAGRTVILASHATAAHDFAGRRIDIRDGRTVAARGAA
jgi:ATP-binding cassette subfamily C protein CydD